MRPTLWSRAAKRPKLTNGHCSSNSPCSPGRGPIVRQAASAQTRRRITVNDLFTLLLTPVLATALLADTSWKDKRRKEWAHRIADVQAETVQIQARALQAWQALQLRSLAPVAAQQRRQYSTAPLRTREHEDDLALEESIHSKHVQLGETMHEPEWLETSENAKKDSAVDKQDDAEEWHVSFTPEMLEKSERLRRLLAIKLALNMTIYLNTGVSASKVRKEIRIPEWGADFDYNVDRHQDLRGLLQRMKDICRKLAHLKEALPYGASPVKHKAPDADAQQLQDEICRLSDRFGTSSITILDFVSSYTLAVLKSPVPPTSKTYLALFRGFARGSGSGHGRSHDLAMQTLFTWEQSRLPMDDHDLFVIMSELARLKHVQKFDGLMRDLTMSPSPLNLTTKWTWERANDIQVPIPKSYSPGILLNLIHCALRFDQPHKAEAWSEILRRTWTNVNDPTQKTPLCRVFTNWMRYWEVQGNWRKGVVWLDAAQKWAITVATFDIYSLQRLAVGMLSLCFTCGKTKEYEEILNAAIDAGIPSMQPEHFLEASARRAICREWEFLHSEAYRNKADSRTDLEKVKAFQSRIRDLALRMLPGKPAADIEWRYEQYDKPNPLLPGQESQNPNQASVQAVETWKQLFYRSREATQDAKVAAENSKNRYLRLERYSLRLHKKMAVLKWKLASEQNLVRSLTGLPAKPLNVEIGQAYAGPNTVHKSSESRPESSRYDLGTTWTEESDNLPLSRLGTEEIAMKQTKPGVMDEVQHRDLEGLDSAEGQNILPDPTSFRLPHYVESKQALSKQPKSEKGKVEVHDLEDNFLLSRLVMDGQGGNKPTAFRT